MPKNAWREFAQFCFAVVRRFHQDRSSQAAGNLTYMTLLALVPLLTVALSVTTAVPAFDKLAGALQDFVIDNFLPDAPGLDMFAEQFNDFTKRAVHLRTLGLALLGVSALLMVHAIDDALNRIFRTERPRSLAARIAVYIALLILGPALIGASVSMTSFLVGASLGALNLGGLTEAVLRFLPFVFTCAALTLLYILVPNRRVALPHALIGGFFAGIAFEVAKRGFALYVSNFPTYALIYGTFATMLLFLLWMYLSWLVVLAGATLTAMLPGFRQSDLMKEQR